MFKRKKSCLLNTKESKTKVGWLFMICLSIKAQNLILMGQGFTWGGGGVMPYLNEALILLLWRI